MVVKVVRGAGLCPAENGGRKKEGKRKADRTCGECEAAVLDRRERRCGECAMESSRGGGRRAKDQSQLIAPDDDRFGNSALSHPSPLSSIYHKFTTVIAHFTLSSFHIQP